MITNGILFTERNFPWTNTIGLGRTILALGSFLTLVFNHTDILFVGSGRITPLCDAFGISLFCLLPRELSRWISIFILLLVIIGWRPRITGVLHWYVSYSFISSATVIDGGDHIASILSLLLVPITLTDSRKWHWTTIIPKLQIVSKVFYPSLAIIAISCLTIIKIQVAVIYLNSAVGKIFVGEWKDGTALYYWFKHPLFGYPSWLSPMLDPLILNGTAAFMLTWGIILFELMLFAALLMDARYKKWFLISGIFFHFMTILIHGLGSFFFTMTAALILYMYPIGRNFTFFSRLQAILADRLLRTRSNAIAVQEAVGTKEPTESS